MAMTMTGVVSSNKADKTIVVTVTSRQTHPIYKKQYTVNRRFMAHDEKNQAKLGDTVLISECRPLSARKRFTLHKIIQKAGAGFEEKDATADIPEPEIPKEKPTPAKAKSELETKEEL